MPRTRGQKVATETGQNKCPFCGKYFKRLGGHLAKSSACKSQSEKLQKILLQENFGDNNMEEDSNSDMEINFGNEEDILSPQAFPASPNTRPQKRMRPTSPNVFLHSAMSPGPDLFSPVAAPSHLPAGQEPVLHQTDEISDLPSEPFEAEKVFQLYKIEEYPQAGHIFQKNCETIFHKMQSSVDGIYPYKPFFDEEEWSLAEFLATSRLSKGSINTFLNSAWVSPIYLYQNYRLSSDTF